MKNSFRPFVALFLVMALVAAACGSGDEIQTTAGDDTPNSDLPTDDDPGDSPDGTQNPVVIQPGDLRIIGSSNLGGEIVDPRPHQIIDLAIAESYPEQLQVSFVAGDANCLAATATAVVSSDGTQVIVALETGITTDALAKSCLAGEFDHTLSIGLEEGLDGRDVVLADVPSGEGAPVDAPPAQPFEETLIGMSETKAEEAAASFEYSWRVMERDGESFMGTTDYSESRINVAITDGVVTRAWLG